MGNFAVSASDEIISQGNSLLEKLQKPDFLLMLQIHCL